MNNNPSQVLQIVLVQGASLVQTISYIDSNGNPIDLTNYTADMQFRSTVQDNGAPIIELSTTNGLIVINGALGTITYTMPSTSTSPLSDGQQMVYNLFIYSPTNIVTPLLAGPCYVQGSTIR